MERPHEKPMPSSHSSSRRTSSNLARESLPTPPPDPREKTSENIFRYPPAKKDLPAGFHGLLDYAEHEREFYKTLNKTIAQDCKLIQQTAAATTESDVTPKSKVPMSASKPSMTTTATGDETHKCVNCQGLHDECFHFIHPLQVRLDSSVTAALAAYGAVEQLNRLYSMWDQFCSLEQQLRQRKECLRYVNLLNEKIQTPKSKNIGVSKANISDTEVEIDQSIALLDSILSTGNSASIKRSGLKQQRQRSKSVMGDDIASMNRADREAKILYTGPHLVRRQSTYSEGKSKVSKWTKVKAAFKWERANVPALVDLNKDPPNGVGLLPVNHEVARYLRVPSIPCGGVSSADSIGSSSGHLLSEAGTPGTVSSASSMDDIDSSCRNAMSNVMLYLRRRDSSKSDTRCDSRITDDGEITADGSKPATSIDAEQEKLIKSDSNKNFVPPKSSSIKSLRKGKVVSDFEVLPEDFIADIKSTPTRKPKPPPSPLNLNLRQDLNDLDYFYSPHLLKSPKDGTQSLNRSKKISSPGNSSVPSSPSRHSDFFAEFESEDLSSGDFSEPTTPNHLSSRKTFQQKQDEINQRYQMLRAKLDMEFETKRREWEKIKANPNACRALTFISTPKPEEYSPNQAFKVNLSAKLLEQNLSPDFKKKLRKWRVKKQIPVSASQSQISPNKDVSNDTKSKIDWNLWKTGQLKLEGQGLSPLPDQKDLPEDFQKKLEQWNKIKRGGSIAGGNGSLKRSSKIADGSRKVSDDDRPGLEKDKRTEKYWLYDRDKLEKLAKFKSIASLSDHPAKKIEVKTSAGVMKFEGISRKFTRKLYEWEKARGIGPESSTFALLHPGYCPIDVGRISKESHKNENSPTLSRSLSLDSVSPNITLPAISHQASSLSLNDVNDLKDIEGVSSCDQLMENEFKKFEEPEAVMVEVEDHIVETASPLITVHTLVEQQTPIYKYEEVACNDYCNSKRIQSYESHTNLAPLLSALKRTDELFGTLKMASPDIADNDAVRQCVATLSFIRNIYPYYKENLMKANVLNAVSDVQSELSRLSELNEKYPLDEACCQEITEERSSQYNEEFKGLHESLDLLRQSIHGNTNRYLKDIVPDINITTEDSHDKSPTFKPTFEATDEHVQNDIGTPSTINRTFNNGNGANLPGCKKKLRLRKMGSRQNSKTESDSSDDDVHSVLETPRRVKRKNFRLKQRSFEEDYRRIDEPCDSTVGEDVIYVLKVKPGHPIEQYENIAGVEKNIISSLSMPTESCSQEMHSEEQPVSKDIALHQNANVFVKTKRKVFSTVEESNTSGGTALLEQKVDDLSGKKVDQPVVEKCVKQESNRLNRILEVTNLLVKYPKKKALQWQKSLSLDDMRAFDFEDERKCNSSESIKPGNKQGKGVRPPLASDSFRVINKSCTTLTRDIHKALVATQEQFGSQRRRVHLFRKNPEKSHIAHTIKKIETKIAKTNSGSAVDQISSHQGADKTDNTLPRICRKLERKSLTPTTQQIKFDYPTPAYSEPTTPHFEQTNKPNTPLSERAQRLQKAKEEFLQGTMTRSKPSFKRRDEIVRNETWEQYRRSDHSLSSVIGEDGNLLKSFSVDTITAGTTPTQSDAGTDQDVGIYDSLPRAVTRSGKISSKLGFATLASKFRRVKVMKKGKADASGDGQSALSTLCRQSLIADIIAVPQIIAGDKKSSETVMKSQSSPQAAIAGGIGNSGVIKNLQCESKRLNKSQSEQYMKESYV